MKTNFVEIPISEHTYDRLVSYCKDTMKEDAFNEGTFWIDFGIEKMITDRLDILEEEKFNKMSKEELIALLLDKYKKEERR